MHMVQLIGACDTFTYKRIQADIATCMTYARIHVRDICTYTRDRQTSREPAAGS